MFAAAALLLLASTRVASPDSRIEASVGADALVSVSPYVGSISKGLSLALHGPIVGSLKWGAGGRLGVGPVRPEGFARLLASPVFDIWEPAAGLEFGVTARNDFEGGDALLRELRDASVADVSPFYIAVHTMPLSFRVSERFRVSALEFQIGTHVSPLGRVVRLEFGLISVGMAL